MHITQEVVNRDMHITQEANGVVLAENFTVFLCTRTACSGKERRWHIQKLQPPLSKQRST